MPAVVSCHCVDDWFQIQDRAVTYGAKFRIKTDTRAYTGIDIADGAAAASPHPLPAFNATYSLLGASDPNAFAQDFDFKRVKAEETGTLWECTVGWRLPDKSDDDATSQDNPLTRPPRFNVEFEDVETNIDQAWNEEELPGLERDPETLGPIQNAAGCEPSSPLTGSRKIPLLIATISVATLEDGIALALAYQDRLNDAVFFGAPEKTAWCRAVTISDELFGGGATYRDVTFQIAIYDEGWSYELVNRGFQYLDYYDDEEMVEQVRLREATTLDTNQDPVPSAEPVNLELDGSKTPDGQIGTVIKYRTKRTADFSGMGLGG